MYLPKQSIPVQRNTISSKYHHTFGVEASDFFVNADRIQGGGGDFHKCRCTCLTSDRGVEDGGSDGVSFIMRNPAAPTIGIHRPSSDNNSL